MAFGAFVHCSLVNICPNCPPVQPHAVELWQQEKGESHRCPCCPCQRQEGHHGAQKTGQTQIRLLIGFLLAGLLLKQHLLVQHISPQDLSTQPLPTAAHEAGTALRGMILTHAKSDGENALGISLCMHAELVRFWPATTRLAVTWRGWGWGGGGVEVVGRRGQGGWSWAGKEAATVGGGVEGVDGAGGQQYWTGSVVRPNPRGTEDIFEENLTHRNLNKLIDLRFGGSWAQGRNDYLTEPVIDTLKPLLEHQASTVPPFLIRSWIPGNSLFTMTVPDPADGDDAAPAFMDSMNSSQKMKKRKKREDEADSGPASMSAYQTRQPETGYTLNRLIDMNTGLVIRPPPTSTTSSTVSSGAQDWNDGSEDADEDIYS
ncbi:hypothetical protein BDK51DRAFT_34233 [Blyttiomyces helicus]|uniref:Uncharacterized protein n=1 Tax=Blyttiomyces helicus TaxID=388810 RepID=A0A4P9WD75_9FUNG|nr:hypothetical protein BDK51DRAFT_34233 [Blyttiomyces helicus]|eukprot:RKO89593.1 hypothetical protein BDK51DRAFT_34233 [Blyttiomyces helicus]